VRDKPAKKDKAMGEVLALLTDPASGCANVTGIVYCLSQKQAEELADFLNDNGIRVGT
jgi:superfamily II DNA helicase RecQ